MAEKALTPKMYDLLSRQRDQEDTLLVLLFLKEATTAGDLAQVMKLSKGETMSSLGELAEAKLAAHRKPFDEDSIHWHATPAGQERAKKLFHKTLAVINAEEAAAKAQKEADQAAKEADQSSEVLEEETAVEASGEEEVSKEGLADLEELKKKAPQMRRVKIDQHEKIGFSWN